MVANRTLLFGTAALAVALLTGCGRSFIPPAPPTTLAPPAPPPAASTAVAPATIPSVDAEQARAEARLRAWEAQLQQQQTELDRRQREADLAALRARQPVAAAPTSQFTSQPWRMQPQPLRDTTPLPPVTAAIPGAAPLYAPPAPPTPTYGYAAPGQPVTPPSAGYGSTPYSTPRSERPRREGIYGPGWPSAEPVYVRGYYRADGTYVRPHLRSYTPR